MLRKKTWLAWTALLVLALLIAVPATAVAMTIRSGESISVPRDETITDDLYAFGNTVTVDGTVDGDVVAFGQTVVITGDVRGSVIGAAQIVRADGTVGGSVRAAGQTVEVGGQVMGDTVAAGSQIGVTGSVSRDLAAAGQAVKVAGMVGRNVMASCETLVIDGDVGGDVQAEAAHVVVGPDGSVGGSLAYTSAEQAVVQGNVTGATTRQEPPAKKGGGGSSGDGGFVGAILAAAIAWVQSFVGVVILGLLLVLIPRGPMRIGSQAALNRPWLSLGVGALVFFATPMVGVFIFVLGLFIGAWWLALVLLAAYLLLFLLGVIAGSLAFGRLLLRHASNGGEPWVGWSLLLGLVLVWIVGLVPVAGAMVGWVVTLIGAGALLVAWMGKTERPVAPMPAQAMPSAQPQSPGTPPTQPQPPYTPEPQAPYGPPPQQPTQQ